MPDVQNLSQEEVQKAYNEFWNDFFDVVKLQDRFEKLLPFFGQDPTYDRGLADIIERQKQILFDLRTIYGELYDSFNEVQQRNIGEFIRRATAKIPGVRMSGLGALGIAPLILAGGVVISILAAGALVAYHRNISMQKDRIALQEKMIPLVASGELPPEVLEQPTGKPGIFEAMFLNVGNLILMGLGVMFLWPVLKDMLKKNE